MSFITTKKCKEKKNTDRKFLFNSYLIAFNMVFPSSNGTVKEENPLHIELVSFHPLCASFYFPSSISLHKSAPFHFSLSRFLNHGMSVCLFVCISLPTSSSLHLSRLYVCLSVCLSLCLSVLSVFILLTFVLSVRLSLS